MRISKAEQGLGLRDQFEAKSPALKSFFMGEKAIAVAGLKNSIHLTGKIGIKTIILIKKLRLSSLLTLFCSPLS